MVAFHFHRKCTQIPIFFDGLRTPMFRIVAILSLAALASCSGVMQTLKEDQKNTRIVYKPAYKVKLSSRESGKVGTQKPKDLAAQGFIRVGSISVEFVTRTCFPKKGRGPVECFDKSHSRSATERLLKEAAKRGGDLVTLSANNAVRSASTTMNGRCIRWEPRYETRQVCRRYSDTGSCAYYVSETYTRQVCTQNEKIYGTQKFQRSSGSVFRKDPVLISQVKYDALFNKALRARKLNKVKRYVSKGIPANKPDLHGNYPIVTASQIGSTRIVGYLLSKGARADRQKSQPLINAVNQKSMSMTRLLVKNGADVNARRGKPLSRAISGRNYKMAEYLLEKGARAGKGNLVSTAVATGDARLVKLLLDRGASPNDSSFGGKPPIQVAAGQRDTAILKLLIKKGANVNKRSMNHQVPPLIIATDRINVEAVEILLKNKARVSMTDMHGITRIIGIKGKTAYQKAQQKLRWERRPKYKKRLQKIIALLEAAGASKR